MISLALRVGGYVLTLDVGRAEDVAVDWPEDETEVVFHGSAE